MVRSLIPSRVYGTTARPCWPTEREAPPCCAQHRFPRLSHHPKLLSGGNQLSSAGLLGFDGRHQLAALQKLLRGRGREQMQPTGNDAGPSGLMAGAQAGAVVAVEVLVEQDQIAPVRVVLEFLRPAVDRPAAI